jgi:hypothetical protein
VSWIANMRTVADPIGAVVSAMPTLDGARIMIEGTFRLTEWPSHEKGLVSLTPGSRGLRTRKRYA